MGKAEAKKPHSAATSSKHVAGAGKKRPRDVDKKPTPKKMTGTNSDKEQSSRKQCTSSSSSKEQSAKKKKTTGLDEIDDLFAAKKSADREQRVQDERDERERKKRRRERRAEEAAMALGGSVAAAAMAAGGGAGASTAAAAPSHLRSRAKAASSLSYTRDDAATLASGEWSNDGLGGIFDAEGYTGRKVDGSMKVYKAHLFNKKGFGTTKDCPFDCDCCYI